MIESYQLNTSEVANLLQEAQRKYKTEISHYYLERTLGVVYDALSQWKRVFALRVDLRMANCVWGDDVDLPTAFQRTDPKVITRFIESLKSQLCEEHRRKGYQGEPCKPNYIWARERVSGELPHYHLVLFFDKDRYAYLGDYRDHGARNMATRIQKAWCSALGLTYPDYHALVHFPENNAYAFDRKLATVHGAYYRAFLVRIAYLSKNYSKILRDGQRNFGCSQTKRVSAE